MRPPSVVRIGDINALVVSLLCSVSYTDELSKFTPILPFKTVLELQLIHATQLPLSFSGPDCNDSAKALQNLNLAKL